MTMLLAITGQLPALKNLLAQLNLPHQAYAPELTPPSAQCWVTY